MGKNSVMSVALSIAAATCVVAVGLVAVPSASQAATAQGRKAPALYLSLGDSYSIGYQPPTATSPGGGSPGYTAWVAKRERMTLENFGCGGATTSSIVNGVGCSDPAATDAVAYPDTTQEQAAVDFIAEPANAGKVGLITISIGGNDVTGCASGGSLAAIVACLNSADAAITTNVTALVSSLNTALTSAGDTAKIVGLTYPDVILGSYVNPGGSSAQALASESVVAFDDLINPTLQSAYTNGVPNGLFVNVTSAPFNKATTGDDSDVTGAPLYILRPYGKLPPAVWEVCKLTYFCSQLNIHANTQGYRFIGKLIMAALHLAES
jgi:lysophospholipase L1-like esterase